LSGHAQLECYRVIKHPEETHPSVAAVAVIYSLRHSNHRKDKIWYLSVA
jgi:hypothetical protein